MEKSTDKVTNNSNLLKITAIAVGIVLIVLVSFASGMAVGIHKARFSNDFGRNYERNFMGPFPSGPMGMPRIMMEGKGFRNGHGLAGQVISISDNTIIIKDRDEKENTVVVSERTIIKDRRKDLKIADLKAGDKIVVIGKPGDDGRIEAELIRMFDNQ